MSRFLRFPVFVSVLFVASIFTFSPTTSQAQSAKNAVYAEALGNGVLYTINYDRHFTSNVSARLGIMNFSVSASGTNSSGNASVTLVPIMANYLVGSGNHNLELGIGPMIANASASADVGSGGFSDSGTTVFGTGTVGYRYQPNDGGFLFRIGLTPMYMDSFGVWGGLSLGWAF